MNWKAKLAIKVGNWYFSKFPAKQQNRVINKTVFFGLPGLGDCLMLTPTIHRYKEMYPSVKISVFAHPHTFQLFQDNPYIDSIIPRHGTDWENLVELRKHNFDEAIMLEMLRTPLLAWAAGIPNRRGIHRNGNGFALTDKFEYHDDLQQNCITWSNLVAGVDDKYTMPEVYNIREDTHHKIIFFPETGTTDIAVKKKWLYWDNLISRFNQKDIIVIKDSTRPLKEVLSLIQGSSVVVCNDSFPLHAAACFNKPTVVVFGPTNAQFLCPYPNAYPVEFNLPCRPCFYNDDLIEMCKTQECLKRITVDNVYSKIYRFLNNNIYISL